MRCYHHPQQVLGLAALVCFGTWCASAQTLTHRYSFADPAGSGTFADSVGGQDGTLNNSTASNPNSAYLDGAELTLDGTGGYANLPSGLITGYTNLTVEFWADYIPGNSNWTRSFSFGDQNASNGKNSGVDYTHLAPGNYQNLDLRDTNAADAYANSSPGLDGVTNAHVTVVVDPTTGTLAYYNGTTRVSTSHGTLPSLLGVNDTFNLIGRSLVDIDPALMAVFHEFRIYTGPFSTRQLALNDASGPTSIVTDPGPVQALHFSASVNPLSVNQSSQQILTGDFTNLTGLNLIAYGGATFTSLNTAVVTINSNGVAKGVAPGTAKVVASFGSLSATNTLSVVAVPAVLAHRYSFTSDASDSVGGANGTIMGSASVSGGQLVLDGAYGSYVDLPGSAINLATNSAVTFDAWVTFGNGSTWAYLFGFGNTNNGGGVGQIACVPVSEGGGFHHWGITENFGGGRTPTWSHPWANMTAHITCVVDPPTSTMSIYRDGVLEVAEYDASAALSNVPTNYAFLGRSFYDADPYLQASIDEFRIYSGALTPAQVALVHQNGPNSTAFDPGALNSIVVVATNYPAFAAQVPPMILANYANLANFNLLATVTAAGNTTLSGLQGLVVTSSDTNIVSVNSANLLTTRRPGTVTLTATYAGKTSSATITVENQAVLAHRYSFNTDGDASDSVGGANGTLQGIASVSGGQLQLTGNNGDYLDLPGGMLSNYTAVTVDTWANLGAAQHWARLWEFADIGSATQNEFYFAPGWNGTPNADFYSAGFPWGASFTAAGPLQNAAYHITCVYGNGTMQLYTNGVLEAGAINMAAPVSNAGLSSATLGHSPFNDPGILGSVDEFRIYQGRLAPDEILASDVLGPNATLSTAPAPLTATLSGGNLVLSWPVANAGFAVQSSSSLRNPSWVTLTNAPSLVGNTSWQVTVPVSGGAQFFRLWR